MKEFVLNAVCRFRQNYACNVDGELCNTAKISGFFINFLYLWDYTTKDILTATA